MARAAYSLDVLLGQLNALAPNRDKASDGWIGDANHQNRTSDHNPWYPPPNGGIVTARDYTHSPDRGLDCQRVADVLVANGDPRIKYIIWNRRIWTPGVGWRNFTGPNPHTKHLHLSVVAAPANDSTRPWAGFSTTPPEVPEMELTDPLRHYIYPFDNPATQDTVGSALANTQSYARTAAQDGAVTKANTIALLAAAKNELTAADYERIVAAELAKLPTAVVDAAAVATLIAAELNEQTDLSPDAVQRVAEASAAAVAARMAD